MTEYRPSLLASFTVSDGRVSLGRIASTGTPREHRVTSFAQVTMGATYWSLIVQDGPEHYLRSRDLVAIENAFRTERLSLGGHTVSSSAATPEAAIAEVLLACRAPTIEAFLPKLFAAVDRALVDKSEDALVAFLSSDAGHREAIAWVVQSLSARLVDATFFDDTAPAALGALLPAGTSFEMWGGTSDLGVPQVTLSATRDGATVGLLLDALARVGVRTPEGFALVQLPASAFDLADEGRHLANLSAVEEVSERLAAALEIAPEDAEIAEHAGATYVMIGDVDTGLELLDRAAETRAPGPWASVSRALANMKVGDGEDPSAALDAAIPLLFGNQRLMTRHNRSLLAGELGDDDLRVALAKENTEEFPHALQAWYSYGLALVQTGQYDASIAATTHLLEELDPEDADAHYSIACAYALRAAPGDDDKALEHVGRATRLDPDLRASIAEDGDFARLKDDPRFRALTG